MRFSLSFLEEGLCPVHEFSWWSLGRNAVGRQMMSRKAVEGDWLILDHAVRLKFQARLVVSGAIVIGRDDGLSRPSPQPLFKCGLRLLGERQRGEPIVGNVLHFFEGSSCGSVLFVGSSMTNIERGCRAQYSFSGGHRSLN